MDQGQGKEVSTQELIAAVLGWARQTVLWALSARGELTKQPMNPIDAGKTADRIVKEIQAQTVKPGVADAENVVAFTRRIIDWSSDHLAGMTTEQDRDITHLRSWGRQTIALAASIRAQDLGKPIDNPQRAVAAGNEFQKTGIELWDSAVKDAGKEAKTPELMMRFARKIFDWTVKHLDGCKLS